LGKTNVEIEIFDLTPKKSE